MKKINVMSIFGTRPEATKMIPLIKELEKCPLINSTVCVTAQHRGMLDQVLNLFEQKTDYDLNIMKQGQTLSHITTSTLQGLDPIIKSVEPDLILVHGDTSTTFAAALSAFYNGIKVGHIEAGLRTYNKIEPFPEEMNRVLTGHIADLHFSPTLNAKRNLEKENIKENIFVTGNTSVDCVSYTIKENYTFSLDTLNKINYNNKIITMTAHRRENLGQPLENICNAVLDIVNTHEDVEVVYAVHFNPKVQEVAHRILSNHPRIHLTDPIDFFDMHNLMNRSYLILTDSGGLQEEAPSFHKPVVVLRNVTERPEGLKAGTLVLAGSEKNNIVNEVSKLLENPILYQKMAAAKNPFGDGFASKRIVKGILYSFGLEINAPKDFHIHNC